MKLAITQRDKMRELYLASGRDEARTVAAYAAAERTGDVERKSNVHGRNADAYARALFGDGIRKGWITTGS